MAKIGMKYWGWAPFNVADTAIALPTYTAGFKLGESVKADLAVTNAEGQFYAEDALTEDVSEFSSGAITGEVDELTLAKQATIYGATIVNDELGFASDDTPPFGGTAYSQYLMKSGVKRYRTFFYPKVKAKISNDSSTTKTNSFTFGTEPISLTVFQPLFGKWRYVKDHANLASAQAYIDSKLGIATWYNVNLLVSGASGSEAAVASVPAVASGGSFTITITGTITKLYDNGADVTESISSGVYTVSTMAADHNIAAIF